MNRFITLFLYFGWILNGMMVISVEGGLFKPPIVSLPNTIGGAPVQISIKFYIEDLGRIIPEEETFQMDYFIFMEWDDDRYNSEQTNLQNDPNFWQPALQTLNSETEELVSLYAYATASGRVHLQARARGRYFTELDVGNFFQDSHLLKARYRSLIFTSSEVELIPVVQPGAEFLSTQAFIPEWRVDKNGIKVVETKSIFRPTGVETSDVEFLIPISRDTAYYKAVIILPLYIIVIISFGVFWLSGSDLSARLGLNVTALLSVVAYSFRIYDEIPKVSYLTNFDYFVLFCFIILLLGALESVIVHDLRTLHLWLPLYNFIFKGKDEPLTQPKLSLYQVAIAKTIAKKLKLSPVEKETFWKTFLTDAGIKEERINGYIEIVTENELSPQDVISDEFDIEFLNSVGIKNAKDRLRIIRQKRNVIKELSDKEEPERDKKEFNQKKFIIVARTLDSLSRVWFFLEFTIVTIVISVNNSLTVHFVVAGVGFVVGLALMIVLGVFSFRRVKQGILLNEIEIPEVFKKE